MGSSFFEKLRPADFIALVIVVIGLRIIATNGDPVVSSLLVAIVGFYFTHRLADDNPKT